MPLSSFVEPVAEMGSSFSCRIKDFLLRHWRFNDYPHPLRKFHAVSVMCSAQLLLSCVFVCRCKEALVLSTQHRYIWLSSHYFFSWFCCVYVLEKLIMSEGKERVDYFLFHRFWDLSFLILSATDIKKINLVYLLSVFALCVCKSSKELCKFRDISTCKSCLPKELQMCVKSSWKTFLGWYFFQRWHGWAVCNFFPSSVVNISDFDNAMARDCDLEIIVRSTLQISLPPFND